MALDLIETWRAIAGRVSARAGFAITIDSAKRWSKRAANPLPVRRWGEGRPRVVADAAELDLWVDRQWKDGGAG